MMRHPHSSQDAGAGNEVTAAAFARPYVVSWNLTYRCNLACEHCYLDAGPGKVKTPAFTDRSELSTEQCYRVIDEIAAFAPECVTILTGGEPLLRRDIVEIVRYGVAKGLWAVVGTNGVKITENLARILAAEGVRGLALSLDALDPQRHDAFRRVRGAWRNTVEGARILTRVGLPFIVQTTVGAHNRDELEAIAAFAHDELGAKVWNLYFLVPSGRGSFVSDLSPAEYDRVLAQLAEIQRRWASKMLVNAKCAPHFVRTLLSADSPAPFPKSFGGGAGGCPAGTHYLGIRPNGDVTPCPYLPLFAGNLSETGLREIWDSSELFTQIRQRDHLGGRCGPCELSSLCGGCRARAYGMTGDVMAEDPLCTHQPGTLQPAVDRLRSADVATTEYGQPAMPAKVALRWEPEARERMQRIPAFVRGMVTRAVESWCEKNGVAVVTATALEEIRARMPTPKVFGARAATPKPPPASD
jgi:radical SAM protein with 4Fe4S-binding SPASM domain